MEFPKTGQELLPQINGFANYNDNIDPPVSVTDGSAYGNPYNITYTLQHNANAGLQLADASLQPNALYHRIHCQSNG